MTVTSVVGSLIAASRQQIEVDEPVGPHRQQHDLDAFLAQAAHALQHAFVLGRIR